MTAALLAALLIPTGAQANSLRVTEGDARAIFEAFPAGGWALRLNGGTLEGATADFMSDSMARITYMPAWNGRHFCALDWHVISVAAIEGNAIGQSRTNAEIRDALTQIEFDFTLDGAPLDTERSAVKRTTNPGFRGLDEAFYIQEGRVIAPEDLAIGQHSLQFTGHRPGQPPNVFPPITFFIDAGGAGVCV
jgi:hypothetical protein